MSGDKIIQGLHEAIDVAKGNSNVAHLRVIQVPENVDVKAVRARLGMSQREFALSFGFPLATVRNWEQGRRVPEKPARLLLRIIEDSPETVERILEAL